MQIFDIEYLSQAITEIEPAGRDLRTDTSPTSLYYQIKDARALARNAERKAAELNEEQNFNKEWQTVYKLGVEILGRHSKDLEIAAWLTEASLRLHQFAGLTAGFKLTTALLQRYWDDLYPRADEEGVSSKVAPIAGLNGYEVEGTLIVPIACLPITEGPVTYALWQYKQALEINKISDPKLLEKRLSNGALTLAKVQASLAATPMSFYVNLRQNLQAAQVAFQEMNQVLDEKCGNDAPPGSHIRKALEDFAEYLGFLLADAPFQLPPSQDVETSAKALSDQGVDKPESVIVQADPTGNAAITNRDQALKTLTQVAQFFAKTEPHSPLPFLLQRAVRWGNLPLPELLKELINDDNARGSVFKLTGIELTETN